MEQERIEQKIKKLIAKAGSFRSKEQAVCDNISLILIEEYGYPEDTSVVWSDDDGYVAAWSEFKEGLENHIAYGVTECLKPYKRSTESIADFT